MDFVWVFNQAQNGFAGEVFTQLEMAEIWISQQKLSGIITKYHLDTGVLEWDLDNGVFSPPKEQLELKMKNPNFVGGFTSACQEHYHYEGGVRCN